MTRMTWGLLMAGALFASSAAAQSTGYDPIQARYLAANCANCHGTDGNAKDGMKALAGYDKDEFVKAMTGFKTGRKPATLMHQLSKGYSDEQIATLAEFFSRQPKPAK